MLDPFEFAAKELDRLEGGFSDLAGDTGGATYWGISETYGKPRFIELFGHWPPASKEEAKQFFKTVYWTEPELDTRPMSPRLKAQWFLLAVNSNPRNANAFLQIALCSAGELVDVDGVYGPNTGQALVYADEQKVYDSFRAAAGAFYWTRDSWSDFKNSWLHRVRLR